MKLLLPTSVQVVYFKLFRTSSNRRRNVTQKKIRDDAGYGKSSATQTGSAGTLLMKKMSDLIINK
jgi:hypothetical protein